MSESKSGIGVYIGAWQRAGSLSKGCSAYGALGEALGALPGRVAASLDARGPALLVDTACSSALVALDLAMADLSTGRRPVYRSRIRPLGESGWCLGSLSLSLSLSGSCTMESAVWGGSRDVRDASTLYAMGKSRSYPTWGYTCVVEKERTPAGGAVAWTGLWWAA